jgi:hypothetical protein
MFMGISFGSVTAYANAIGAKARRGLVKTKKLSATYIEISVSAQK